MKTDEWGEPFEAERESPPVGETAAEMMDTMNIILRNLRDQGQEYLEANDGLHGGPCCKENFQWNWSNVEYSRHVVVVARQDTFDRILQGADHLIASATASGAAEQPRPSGTRMPPGSKPRPWCREWLKLRPN
jgi:hypothetical protein